MMSQKLGNFEQAKKCFENYGFKNIGGNDFVGLTVNNIPILLNV